MSVTMSPEWQKKTLVGATEESAAQWEISDTRVEIAGIALQPHREWMVQVAGNLVDCVYGFLKGKKYLILDRNPSFTNCTTARCHRHSKNQLLDHVTRKHRHLSIDSSVDAVTRLLYAAQPFLGTRVSARRAK